MPQVASEYEDLGLRLKGRISFSLLFRDDVQDVFSPRPASELLPALGGPSSGSAGIKTVVSFKLNLANRIKSSHSTDFRSGGASRTRLDLAAPVGKGLWLWESRRCPTIPSLLPVPLMAALSFPPLFRGRVVLDCL